jgi:hypothetical protein
MYGCSEGRVTLTFCFSLCSCDGGKQAGPLMICGVGFVRSDGCGVPGFWGVVWILAVVAYGRSCDGV